MATTLSLDEVIAQKINWKEPSAKKFPNLFNNIKKKFLLQFELPKIEEKTPLNPEVRAQQEQAGKYLTTGYYGSYLTMLRAGYTPTPEQNVYFQDQFKDIFGWNSKINHGKLLEDHVQDGGKIDTDMMFYLLIANRDDKYQYLYRNIASKNEIPSTLKKEHPVLAKAFEEQIKEPEFATNFVANWLNEAIKSNNSLNYSYHRLIILQESMTELLKDDSSLLFNNINVNQAMAVVDKFKEVFDGLNQRSAFLQEYDSSSRRNEDLNKIHNWIHKTMPEFIEQHYKNDIINKMQKTREVYTTNATQSVKKSV
jgi:hypothetical protein